MSPAEHDLEHAVVFAEYLRTVRELRRVPTDELRDRLAACCEMLNYSDRVRAKAGGWPRYYRAFGGKVHTTLQCRGLTGRNSRVFVMLLADLSGVTDLQVVARHGKPCRHCIAVTST